MRTLLTIAFVFLLAQGCAPICTGGWTKTDTTLELAGMGLTAVDWRQTTMIARNPATFYETNKILGLHPSVGFVNGYFALAVLHPAVSCLLPPVARHIWQVGTIIVEGSVVIQNERLGLK